MYDLHEQHYEQYRRLLEHAQQSGNRALAIRAAHMLLFHLRQLFQSLPLRQRRVVKLSFAPHKCELPILASHP